MGGPSAPPGCSACSVGSSCVLSALPQEEWAKLDRKLHRIYGVISGGCGILSSLTIQPNGNVLPCRIFELASINEEVILGNVKEAKLGEIWNSLKARRIRECAANLESMSLNCRSCKYYDPVLFTGVVGKE